MKIAYFIKRQDVCYYLRVFVPSTHLGFMGNETREILVEHQIFCKNPNCKNKSVQEVRHDFSGDVYSCTSCFTPLMDGLNKWKQSIYEALDWCDVSVFQRNTHQPSLDLMIECKRRGKLVIGEHDDNYIDIPDSNNGAKYYRQQRPVVEEMLRVAHGHTVTTRGLRDFYSKYNKNIQIIPNAWDVDVYDATPPLNSLYIFNGKNQQISIEQFQKAREGRKFVCWAGSPTHEKDLEIVIKPLKKLIERENVIVGMCAFVHRQMMNSYPSDNLFLFGLVPAMGWYGMLKFLKPNVWLGPVEKNEFNRGKSNLKFQEAALMGSSFVGTDFDTYNQCDLSGYLVQNTEDSWWYSLRKAVNESADEITETNNHNREIIMRDFDIKQTVKIWDRFFKSGVANEV